MKYQRLRKAVMNGMIKGCTKAMYIVLIKALCWPKSLDRITERAKCIIQFFSLNTPINAWTMPNMLIKRAVCVT